ncbi:hypothetical protein OSB04_030328 [Centaurea solstitialis]|uniref:Uncharacterized protein n=1 Tax=Centaurea solstitialis TaxID=347529 RepID=A0AA38SK13_9ASTR|nr:hypothetical protein OSB04_030328 [Centaurea solstitialis]
MDDPMNVATPNSLGLRYRNRYTSMSSPFGWLRLCGPLMVSLEYLKKHPSKSYIANRPFPQYERLKTIFGRDRATGTLAESAADAMECKFVGFQLKTNWQ